MIDGDELKSPDPLYLPATDVADVGLLSNVTFFISHDIKRVTLELPNAWLTFVRMPRNYR